MIKIDWDQIKKLRLDLRREGFTDSSDIAVIIIYRNATDAERFKIKLSNIERFLYELCPCDTITAIHIYDAEIKRPYWRIKEDARPNELETVPATGHTRIVSDFHTMLPEQRQVWLDITIANLTQYLNNQ